MPALAFITEFFIFLLVVAGAFVLLTLVASFLRFYFLTQQLARADTTGLNAQEVFTLRVVQQLGGLHQEPEPFTLMLVDCGPVSTGESEGTDNAAAAAVTATEQCFKEQLRHKDLVLRRSDTQLGVIGQFIPSQAGPILERLVNGASARAEVRIGVVSYPAHGTGTQALIDAAETALATARAQGQPYCWGGEGPPAEPETEPAPPPAESTGRPHAMVDEVTGALKAERLGAALAKMVARQRTAGDPVSVVYCSIDHFRQYINHYQQAAGDTVCQAIATVLADDTRDTDILARADEADFALVLDCAPAHALQVARRLAAQIKRQPIQLESRTLNVTVSMGVAGHPNHTGQAREMLEFARTAMWNARARGANLCLAYEASMLKHDTTGQTPKDAF